MSDLPRAVGKDRDNQLEKLRPQIDRCLGSRAKRTLDVLGSLLGLLLLSPLMLPVMVLVFIQDRGPVFFRQRRTGLNGRVFLIWKFRTMSSPSDPGAFRQTTGPVDPRITPLGRWLRASSIDELPQLINVLKGEMSLVGPRPHPTELDEAFADRIAGYRLRHCVRPGLTGMAQVGGARGPIETLKDMQVRYDLDLKYIREWSLAGDLRLMLRTVLSPAARHGAF